jgi:hypothetical protein
VDRFARRVLDGIATGVALAPIAMALACVGSQKLGGEGATCLQVTDCREGLVCVPQTNGPNICSSDLSTIQLTEDATAPKDAAPRRDAAGDASSAADAPAADDASQGDTAAPANDAGASADSAPSDDAATE